MRRPVSVVHEFVSAGFANVERHPTEQVEIFCKEIVG